MKHEGDIPVNIKRKVVSSGVSTLFLCVSACEIGNFRPQSVIGIVYSNLENKIKYNRHVF